MSTRKTRTVAAKKPPQPNDDAPFEAKVEWLLQTYAFNETSGMVVDLYATGDDCEMTMEEFHRRFAHWHEIRG